MKWSIIPLLKLLILSNGVSPKDIVSYTKSFSNLFDKNQRNPYYAAMNLSEIKMAKTYETLKDPSKSQCNCKSSPPPPPPVPPKRSKSAVIRTRPSNPLNIFNQKIN